MWYITDNIIIELHKVLLILRYKKEEVYCIKFCTTLPDPELKYIEVTYVDEEGRDKDFNRLKDFLSTGERTWIRKGNNE